jgi:hypothetical protein
MQQQMCYVGQQQVFTEASENFMKLTGVSVSAKQIERVCHHYGGLLEQQQQEAITEGGQDKSVQIKGRHYAMVDGGMLLTREEKWKEMKLARIFKADEVVTISKDRGYIADSRYVAHLGIHHEFFEKVEYHLDAIADKVFIADGAKWIWKWVDAKYPGAIQILDFYHAKEHLCQFAQVVIADEAQRKLWIEQQTNSLLNDEAEKVIADVKNMSVKTHMGRKIKKSLVAYYQQNSCRMLYRTYRQAGLLIGSGAMEAAHRHVIQHRMKLSGQRWTIKGAQKMANLRVTFKSNQWNHIVELTKKAA